MENGDVLLIETKKELVIKDLETAFQVNAKLSSYHIALRGWSLTLTLAYSGLIISGKVSSSIMLLPLSVVFGVFAYLEANIRRSGDFSRETIIAIEEIFMRSNWDDFAKGIQQYQFRDLRYQRRSLGRGIKENIQTILISRYSSRIILWYFLLLIPVFVSWLCIRLSLLG